MSLSDQIASLATRVATEINSLRAQFIAKNATVDLEDSTNDQLFVVRVHHDGTTTSGWPNRLEFQFEDGVDSGVFRRTTSFGEYGEYRGVPARSNTIPFRVFEREYNTDPARDTTVPILQTMDNRNDRNEQFAVMPGGEARASAFTVDGAHPVFAVFHGSDANFARPSLPSGAVAMWIGTVQPTNAVTGVDVVIRGDEAV